MRATRFNSSALFCILHLSLTGCGGGNNPVSTLGDSTSAGNNNAGSNGNNPQSTSGKIVFTSDRDNKEKGEIYVMNADGTNVQRLTNNSYGEAYEDITPDGSKIIFASDRDFNGQGTEIYSMDPDGQNQKRITNNSWDEIQFSISPDAKKVVYVKKADPVENIYLINTDGTGETKLTDNPTLGSGSTLRFIYFSPSFSPDGTRIAYHSMREGDYEIYLMNLDGSDTLNLTNNSDNDLDPAFASGSVTGTTNQNPVIATGTYSKSFQHCCKWNINAFCNGF